MHVADEFVLTALCDLQNQHQDRTVFSWLDILEYCMGVNPSATKSNFVNMFNALHNTQNAISPFVRNHPRDEMDFFAINSDIDSSLLNKITSNRLRKSFETAMTARKIAKKKLIQLRNSALDLTAYHDNAELNDFDNLLPNFSIRSNQQQGSVLFVVETDPPNSPALTTQHDDLYKDLTAEVVFDVISNHILTNRINLFDYKTIISALINQYAIKKAHIGLFLKIIRAKVHELENLTYCCKYVTLIRHIDLNTSIPAKFYIPLRRESMMGSAPSLLQKYCELVQKILTFQKKSLSNISLVEQGKLKPLEQGIEKRRAPVVDIQTLKAMAAAFIQEDCSKRNTIILNAFLNLYEQFSITTFSMVQLITEINPAFLALNLTKAFQLHKLDDSSFENLYAGIVTKICQFPYFARNKNEKDFFILLNKEKKFNKDDFHWNNEMQFVRITTLFNNCSNKALGFERLDLILTLMLTKGIQQKSNLFFTEEYFSLVLANTDLQQETCLEILNHLLKLNFFKAKTNDLLALEVTNEFLKYIRFINPKLLPKAQELNQICLKNIKEGISSLNSAISIPVVVKKPNLPPSNPLPMEIEVINDTPSNNMH